MYLPNIFLKKMYIYREASSQVGFRKTDERLTEREFQRYYEPYHPLDDYEAVESNLNDNIMKLIEENWDHS